MSQLLRWVAACVLLAGPAARAEPALWSLRSATATVYLFGTIHELPPGAEWRSAKSDQAFARAGDLWLEIANPDDVAAQSATAMKYGVDAAHPLSTKLPPALLARLDAAIRHLGNEAGEKSVEPLRPWLVAMAVLQTPMQDAGLQPSSGVDGALKADADATGKPVHGLETIEQQIRIFADLPRASEVDFLSSALDDVAGGAAKLRAMVAAWEAGDVKALEGLIFDDGMPEKAPLVHQAVFAKRNAAWADWLTARLKVGGTSFVAVGVGHLVGPDSVLDMLRRRGITAVRE
jgi:uncharacterized protein YbaP (TraB family)